MTKSGKKEGFKASAMAEILEKILRIVPGVGHYQDKEKIRHWDKELRLQIAGKLETLRRSVEDITRELAEAGTLKPLKGLGDINNKLDRVRDKIKFASYGYAGIFDPHKIREPELQKHYEFDLQIAESTVILEAVLEDLKTAAEQRLDINVSVKNMIREIESLEAFFQQRDEFIVSEKSG